MEKIITQEAVASLPTKYGNFKIYAYVCKQGKHHVALVHGDILKKDKTLVRVHSECLTGDVFQSEKCDCGQQVHQALKMISKEDGVLLFLRQDGRGWGLVIKIKAYELQDKGFDTVEANEKLGFKPDERDYTVGAQILADLGVTKIRLLTNNPKKIEGLEKYGMKIVERVPLIIDTNENTKDYISTKIKKLGHMMDEKGVVK